MAGLLLAALFAVPANADPVTYGSNGVFGVGAEPPEGWATASIPPGRYRVDQSPSMYPYLSPPGFWLRCNDFLPTDVALSLNNVTLTVAG